MEDEHTISRHENELSQRSGPASLLKLNRKSRDILIIQNQLKTLAVQSFPVVLAEVLLFSSIMNSKPGSDNFKSAAE